MKPIFIAFTFLVFTHSSLAVRDKQYRKDYVYNRKTDAFYKFHIETISHDMASGNCELEGAKLMVVTSHEDIAQAHGMMKQYPDLGDYAWIGDDGQQHESAEEAPIIDLTPTESQRWGYPRECDVITRDGDVKSTDCYVQRPFICKVAAKDVRFDERCGVQGVAYKYLNTTGSCYSVPNRAMTWNEAYAECRSEDSHLVVLNSEAEHLAIMEFLQTTPQVTGATVGYFYLAGIRAERTTDGTPRVFRTVFNETLEVAGYTGWADGEPNNYRDEEYCGSIFRNNGQYNDVNCNDHFAFICEKEVK